MIINRWSRLLSGEEGALPYIKGYISLVLTGVVIALLWPEKWTKKVNELIKKGGKGRDGK